MSNNKTITVQELKEQFVQECTILDPKKEYPGYTGKEKYFTTLVLYKNCQKIPFITSYLLYI